MRDQLGAVGIVTSKLPFEYDLSVPAKGPLAGAGRKSARWAGTGMGVGGISGLSLIADTCQNDKTGIFCGTSFVVATGLAAIGLVMGGTAGSVVGAFKAESSSDVSQAEEIITAIITSQDMQRNLCNHVAEVARQKPRNVVSIQDQIPSVAENSNQYRFLAEKNIDTILELSLTRIALEGEWDINPPLTFQMEAHIRLVTTIDGKKSYATYIIHQGSSRLFSEWAADNGEAFIEALDMGFQDLAEKIINELYGANPATPVPETQWYNHNDSNDKIASTTSNSFEYPGVAIFRLKDFYPAASIRSTTPAQDTGTPPP
jgi:gas vesicle protein